MPASKLTPRVRSKMIVDSYVVIGAPCIAEINEMPDAVTIDMTQRAVTMAIESMTLFGTIV